MVNTIATKLTVPYFIEVSGKHDDHTHSSNRETLGLRSRPTTRVDTVANDEDPAMDIEAEFWYGEY